MAEKLYTILALRGRYVTMDEGFVDGEGYTWDEDDPDFQDLCDHHQIWASLNVASAQEAERLEFYLNWCYTHRIESVYVANPRQFGEFDCDYRERIYAAFLAQEGLEDLYEMLQGYEAAIQAEKLRRLKEWSLAQRAAREAWKEMA